MSREKLVQVVQVRACRPATRCAKQHLLIADVTRRRKVGHEALRRSRGLERSSLEKKDTKQSRETIVTSSLESDSSNTNGERKETSGKQSSYSPGRDEEVLLKTTIQQTPVSNFEGTGSGIKLLVSGLTKAINTVSSLLTLTRSSSERASLQGDENKGLESSPLSPAELRDGLQADFENAFLFTGDINENLYAEQCTFTDPTLSFTGRETFKKNIKAIKPILNALVVSPGGGTRGTEVELYDCLLDEESSTVVATWRMRGRIRLPWQPQIDLCGRTTFTFDPVNSGGRIIQYYEEWSVSALEAVMQLLKPSRLS